MMDGVAPCSQRLCVRTHGLLPLERVHMLPLLASVSRRGGCIDGRGASFAVSAVEVLKASGSLGTGRVTVSHPSDLWTCHDKHPRATVAGFGVGI